MLKDPNNMVSLIEVWYRVTKKVSNFIILYDKKKLLVKIIIKSIIKINLVGYHLYSIHSNHIHKVKYIHKIFKEA